MTEIVKEKSYPLNYPSDVVSILNAMSFTNGKDLDVLGSNSLRSQQYAGDYDGYERVRLNYSSDKEALIWLRKRFQDMIKDLRVMDNIFIGDIKGGVVEEWRVIPLEARVEGSRVVGYNSVSSRKVVDILAENKVITPAEKEKLLQKLLPALTPAQLIELKQECKYHIVRWTINEVLENKHILPNNRIYTLEDAFSSRGITKLDVIGLVQNNRYTDFSVIYSFFNKGKALNPEPIDIYKALNESIIFYTNTHQPFKALKRKFSLARLNNNTKELKKLNTILNSDLGRLYLVLSDLGTLITLITDHNPPMEKVRYEIDQFKARLSNIYSLENYLRNEHTLLGDINSALKITDKEHLVSRLQSIEERLIKYLEDATKLSGGAATYQPVVDIDEIKNIKNLTKNNKYLAVKNIEKQLRELAHYYRFRNPVLSFGYRMLADDMWRQIPKVAPPDDKTNKDYAPDNDNRDADPKHLHYVKKTAEYILNQDDETPIATDDTVLTKLRAYLDKAPFDPQFDKVPINLTGKLKITKRDSYIPYAKDFKENVYPTYDKIRLAIKKSPADKQSLAKIVSLFHPKTEDKKMIQRIMTNAPYVESKL